MGCDLEEVGSAETCFANTDFFFPPDVNLCNSGFFPRFSVLASHFCFYDFNILCFDFETSVSMLRHLLVCNSEPLIFFKSLF